MGVRSDLRGFARALTVGCVAAIVLAGASSVEAAESDLDPTFGADGRVKTDLAFVGRSDDRTADTAVQPDGKVVAVGSFRRNGEPSFAVARYLPDGSLDPAFNGGLGVHVIDFDNREDHASAVVIQPDGKIVVVGWSFELGDVSRVAIARLNPSGSLDGSFGSGGKTYDEAAGIGVGAALQGDGRLVVAIDSYTDNFTAARFLPDGSLDPGYGSAGVADHDLGSLDDAAAIALAPDGKAVLSGISGPGVSGTASADHALATARLTAGGGLDPSFNGTGFRINDLAGGDRERLSAVAVRPDRSIVAVGSAGSGGSSAGINSLLARYSATGAVEGLDRYDVGGGLGAGSFDVLNSIAVLPNGKIVAGGFSLDDDSAGGELFALRTLANGRRDRTFSGDGVAGVRFSAEGRTQGTAIVAQPDGKLVVAGRTETVAAGESDYDLALARFKLNGDTVPPVASIRSGPSGGRRIAERRPRFSFASEPGARFRCALDGGPFAPCRSPRRIGPLADGRHRLRVTAIDEAGNVDPTPASAAFIVDTKVSSFFARPLKRRQRQHGKRVAAKLRARAGESASIVARGSVLAGRRSFRLRRVRRSLAPDRVRVLRMTPRRPKDHRRIFKLLRRGKRVQARVLVTATDAVGNTARRRVQIRLR